MPRYITAGSNFTPFTYDELVKPVDNMTQAYNTAQEQYDNLATTTAQLERYINDNPDDEETRAIYNNYMSSLQKMQDSLYNTGYTANTARELSNARRMYGQNIVPMSEAIQRRRDWNDKYLQMQIEHPEMIMGKAPGSYSVKDYMNDTNFGGFKNYSSAQLTSDASSAAKAAASALEKRPRKWTTEGVPAGYYQTEMTTGYTEQEVEDAMRAFKARQDSISGDSRANDLLQIAKDIYSKSGIGSWETDSSDIFDRAADAIGAGLRSGIGETKYEMVQRRDGIYSPNYKPRESKDDDTPKIPTVYSTQRGIAMVVDPKIKGKVKSISRAVKLIDSLGENPNVEDVEAYGKIANSVLKYWNGKLPPKEYDKIISEYPEFAKMDKNEIKELAKFKKISDMYDEYGLTGDNRNIASLYYALSDESDNLVKEQSFTTFREEDTDEVMKLFEQNTIGRNEHPSKWVEYARYNDGTPLSTAEFNALLSDDKGYIKSNHVQIDGRSGRIRVTPVNGRSVYLDSSLIRHTPPVDIDSALRIINGFIYDNYDNKALDGYINVAAQYMLNFINSTENAAGYDPEMMLAGIPNLISEMKASNVPNAVINAVEGSFEEALTALITTGTIPLPNATKTFTNPYKP